MMPVNALIPGPKTFIPTCRFARRIGAAVIAAFVLVIPVARAQEGHPLTGTWHGTWGPNANTRTDVTLVFDYDGKAITGMINPGPDAIRFSNATLDPSTWTVHVEATPKGTSAASRIVIDARIDDVTNRRRRLVGTWTQGSAKGDFTASRDD